ncbi:MAG: preprotein translocase subunit SecY [Firmicutes bacterium]|nr:preprotein translocase subunit SecY [Bacillota bacterium]
MLETLRGALRIGDLRRRIVFTFWMFLVFRAGAHVPVPGIKTEVISQLFKEGTIFAFLDMFSGGALKTFSIFAMSITPYINSSIIMQLLTIIIPSWEKLAKEEDGRKKLNEFTRYGTVVLALIQGFSMAIAISRMGALVQGGVMAIAIVVISLTAGTAFLMWLGEQITEKGIGNGISLIIFAGIISRLPSGLYSMVQYLLAGRIGIINIAVLLVIAAAVIAAIVWINEGERRIPVQYSKRVVGRKVYGGASTHIPMKINQAGVIPVIFASSVLAFPATIASFINAPWARAVEQLFDYRRPGYLIAYTVLILFFTYFYTAITFNPIEISNNMKKYGGFIPGIRPGKPTAEHLFKISNRITLAGSVFLAIIAILPNFVLTVTNIPGLQFGGTGLLIVVSVALETMRQIEAQMLLRHYQGFIK